MRAENNRPADWMRASGFVFAAVTVIPILAGVHVGGHYGHAAVGGLIGAVAGFALGAWLAIRPVWRDTEKKGGTRRPG